MLHEIDHLVSIILPNMFCIIVGYHLDKVTRVDYINRARVRRYYASLGGFDNH